VATVILATGVLTLSSVAASANQLRKNIFEKAMAAEALDRELAVIEATPFEEIQADHDGRGFEVVLPGRASSMLTALPGDPDGLPGIIEVRVPDPPNNAEFLLEVELRLEWAGTNGPRRLSRIVQLSRLGTN
jgi:hypothetical protein